MNDLLLQKSALEVLDGSADDIGQNGVGSLEGPGLAREGKGVLSCPS